MSEEEQRQLEEALKRFRDECSLLKKMFPGSKGEPTLRDLYNRILNELEHNRAHRLKSDGSPTTNPRVILVQSIVYRNIEILCPLCFQWHGMLEEHPCYYAKKEEEFAAHDCYGTCASDKKCH